MAKYMISIIAGEGCNPEYGPDKELENMGVDGFFVVGFRNQKPFFESMMGCSISDLSKWIMNRSPAAQPIRAACAIANGEIAAGEIMEVNRVPDFGTLTGTAVVSEDMIRKILGKDGKEW